MKNINIAFGKRVQFLRKKKDISQLQFSNEIGLSTGYLAEIESGTKGRNPTLEVIEKIAKGLNISIAELLRASFKTLDFEQYLCQTQIIILKILRVFLWL